MWLSRMMMRRPALGPPEHMDGALDPVDVVGIADPQHVPAVAQKAGRTSSVKVMFVLPSMVMWLLS